MLVILHTKTCLIYDLSLPTYPQVEEPMIDTGPSRVDATEVMNTLLVHEKKATAALIPGAGSDESSSSSEDESALKPTVISGSKYI